VPILGVNVGMLGYLNEVEVAQLDAVLPRLAEGDYALDERMMLAVEVQPAEGEPRLVLGLNEAVVEKSEPGHTVRLLVSIDGTPFTTFAADGLIVATPTGSTAYSLSARGPIVSPRHKALVLTPVSPHMLFDRSLVLDPSEVVRFDVLGHRPATLSVDGNLWGTLVDGDAVVISPAAHAARLITFGGRRFHRILKAKFGLTDR
jgi:NAD+ kinase